MTLEDGKEYITKDEGDITLPWEEPQTGHELTSLWDNTINDIIQQLQ